MSRFAVIGGTGFEQMTDFAVESETTAQTPWGQASHPALRGRIGGRPLWYLPRHGRPHHLPPHRINYRANLWLLREQGVQQVIAINAVGGLRAELQPGQLLAPSQIIDYTWGREHSYYDGGEAGLEHVDFSSPYCSELRAKLLLAATACGESCIDGGVYAATQGPRLESAAEVTRLHRDGGDVVGMTGMPETGLARELGLNYASLCLVVNPGAGLAEEPITLDAMREVLETSASRISAVITRLLAAAETG